MLFVVTLILFSWMITACDSGQAPTAVPTSTPVAQSSETSTPAYPTVTPTPTVKPTDTPVPPTPTPTPIVYKHPSGAFNLILPEGITKMAENNTGATFSNGKDSQIIIGFFSASTVLGNVGEIPLTPQQLEGIIKLQLDTAKGMGLIDDYVDLKVKEMVGNQFSAEVNYSSVQVNGHGTVMIVQDAGVIYVLTLLTPNYESVKQAWESVTNSFKFDSQAAKAVNTK